MCAGSPFPSYAQLILLFHCRFLTALSLLWQRALLKACGTSLSHLSEILCTPPTRCTTGPSAGSDVAEVSPCMTETLPCPLSLPHVLSHVPMPLVRPLSVNAFVSSRSLSSIEMVSSPSDFDRNGQFFPSDFDKNGQFFPSDFDRNGQFFPSDFDRNGQFFPSDFDRNGQFAKFLSFAAIISVGDHACSCLVFESITIYWAFINCNNPQLSYFYVKDN